MSGYPGSDNFEGPNQEGMRSSRQNQLVTCTGYANYSPEWTASPDYASFFRSEGATGLWPAPLGYGGDNKESKDQEPRKVNLGGNLEAPPPVGNKKSPGDKDGNGFGDGMMGGYGDGGMGGFEQQQMAAYHYQVMMQAAYNLQYFQAMASGGGMGEGNQMSGGYPGWQGGMQQDQRGGKRGKGGKGGGGQQSPSNDDGKNKRERRRRGRGQSSQAATQAAAQAAEATTTTQNPFLQQVKKATAPNAMKNLTFGLAEIKNDMVEFAKDSGGSRFIQTKLEGMVAEDIDIVFEALCDRKIIADLAIDCFGNYVIQKLFEYGKADYRNAIAECLKGEILRLSTHMYGCRIVQKALETVSIATQVEISSELHNNVIKCVEDMNGNHVVQKCIERMPPEKVQFIVESFKGVVKRMSMHCYGCRVVQRLIEHCTQQQMVPILDEILKYVPDLSDDSYGNYVIQHVLSHGRTPDKKMIIEMVRRNLITFSSKKCASNVVEKSYEVVFQETELEAERKQLLTAALGEPGDQNPAIHTMMRDKYGNYIVQRMIESAPEKERMMMVDSLKSQLHTLKKFTHGKHVMTAIAPYLEGNGETDEGGTPALQ